MISLEMARTLFMAGVVALAVGVYVVLDGFDLGIGILFPFAADEVHRDRMIESIEPFWDGNETWLVFGGAILLATFPLAFSIIMPAVYLPVIVMVLGLIFRGVAFEFRFKHSAQNRLWDVAFAGGSIVATFAQGVVLGTFIQGIPVQGNHYAGGLASPVTPFSAFTGVALLIGYATLGAGWLYWRVGGEIQRQARLWLPKLLAGLIACLVVVSAWTPLMSAAIARRWFDYPNFLFFSPVPLLTASCVVGFMVSLKRQTPSGWPFAFAIALFFLSYAGLAISIFPMLPPPAMSLFDVAASGGSQNFLLPGVVLLVPLILLRTWLNYRVFSQVGE